MMQLNLFALPILRKHDGIDGYIFACPYCHRYVMASHGVISLYAQAAAMMMIGALAGASVLWLAYKVTKHLSR